MLCNDLNAEKEYGLLSGLLNACYIFTADNECICFWGYLPIFALAVKVTEFFPIESTILQNFKLIFSLELYP